MLQTHTSQITDKNLDVIYREALSYLLEIFH